MELPGYVEKNSSFNIRVRWRLHSAGFWPHSERFSGQMLSTGPETVETPWRDFVARQVRQRASDAISGGPRTSKPLLLLTGDQHAPISRTAVRPLTTEASALASP